jgi:hypothetical protein
MRLSRTDFFPVLTIIAGGVIGASLTFGVLGSSSANSVPTPLAGPMTTGLVAYFPLDGNADDASGNGHHGDVYGATLIRNRDDAADLAYRIHDFDYISLDANAFDGLNDFTLSFDVLFDGFNEGFDAYNTILSVASQGQDNELSIGYASDKSGFDVFANQFFIAMDTEFGSDPDLRPFNTNTVVKDGEWHIVTVTRSGSTATLYIDGNKAGGSISVPSNAIRAAANGAILGQEQDGVGTRFDINQNLSGQIDDVYVYDRALSESEVQSLHSRTHSRTSRRTARAAPVWSPDGRRLLFRYVDRTAPRQFGGADPAAGPHDPRPNSERASSEFDEAARALGQLNVISFEDLDEGPFNYLEVAPGVSVSQTGTTSEGGLVSGCFLDCASDVRRGYNVTPDGEKYLGVALIFEVGTATLDFSFKSPIQAFGTHIIGLGTANGDLFIEFDDGAPRSIPVTGNAQGGAQFFGFTAPGASINRVTLTLRNVVNGSRDNFSVDGVRYTSTKVIPRTGVRIRTIGFSGSGARPSAGR